MLERVREDLRLVLEQRTHCLQVPPNPFQTHLPCPRTGRATLCGPARPWKFLSGCVRAIRRHHIVFKLSEWSQEHILLYSCIGCAFFALNDLVVLGRCVEYSGTWHNSPASGPLHRQSWCNKLRSEIAACNPFIRDLRVVLVKNPAFALLSCHLSLKLSDLYLSTGCSRYSMARRSPVRISPMWTSGVACMPVVSRISRPPTASVSFSSAICAV
jgi:hypothetical protein